MTEDQKKVLEELKANDQHLERGEIKLVKRDSGMEYFERLSSNHFEGGTTMDSLVRSLLIKEM